MNKRFVLVAACALALVSCGGGKDINLDEGSVVPGTFSLNTLSDKRLISGASSARQMLMDGYTIMRSPVTEGQWAEVMGGKASDPEAPKAMVSYDDCVKFAKKLSKAAGKEYMVPTEAMWEYAVKSGVISPDAKVREWTSSESHDVDGARVVRSAKERESVPAYTRGPIVFRVAAADGTVCPESVAAAMKGVQGSRESVSEGETVTVNGVEFRMIGIPGATLAAGGTAEQGKYADDDEKPVQVVDVADFELGRTEVTVGQWLAVMEDLPLGNLASEPEKPVINVSWYAAQEYILKLNELSGRQFRLPTEFEWEYAARGGAKSGHYRYAGSNRISDVAVYADKNEPLKVAKVASLQANELGLYDLSGNAWEWCLDSYIPYGDGSYDVHAGVELVPGDGPLESEAVSTRVMRGGSSASNWKACRVSNRSGLPADNVKSTFGFRLAL